MKTLVVIPTYNEKENLASVVSRVLALETAGVSVCIVDDASPDGTGKLADELRAAHPHRVHVIHREKKLGIGSAYLEGFRYGVEQDFDFLCEMDGDGSHDPKDLPRLIAAAKSGADVVVGSRRVKGGGVQGWGVLRHAMSSGATAFSRLFLGLKTKDATSGFRCYGRQAIEKLLSHHFASRGYAFQEEALFRCERDGFRIEEVPILFRDRERGSSKLGWREVGEFFRVMFRLRFGTPAHALANLFFFTLVIAFAFAVCAFKVMDRDFWWHIKAGEIIWNTRHLIVTEPFAYTREGLPYLANHEWLAQVILYLVDRFFGIDGIIVFRSLMAAVTVSIPLWFYRKHLWLTSFVAIWAVNLLRPGLMDRPQLFTFVLLSLFVTLALRELDDRSDGTKMNVRLWAMVAIIAVWVNVHGAAALIGFTTYACLLCQLAWRKRGLPARRYLVAGAFMCLAVFVSPNGIGNVTYMKDLLNDQTVSYIAEWQPRGLPDYVPMYGLLWVAVLAACLFGGEDLVFCGLLFAGTAYLSLKAVRHEMLFVIASSAIVIYQLNVRGFMKKADGWLRPRAWAVIPLVGLFTLGSAWGTWAKYDAFARQDNLYGYGAFDLARGANDFINREGIQGHMFNTYGIGGYLLNKGYPDRKIYIDGRNVDYGLDFMTRTFAAGVNPDVWKQLEQKYDLTYALIDYDAAKDRVKDEYPFSDHLDTNKDWALVYLDDWVGVYLKDAPDNKEKISRLKLTLVNPRNLDKQTVVDDTKDDQLPQLETELKRVAADDVGGFKGPLALAKLYMRTKRTLEARAMLQDAIEVQPHRAQLYEELATTYTADEKWAEAAHAYAKMIEFAGDQYPDINYGYIADVFDKAGDAKTAEKYRAMDKAAATVSADQMPKGDGKDDAQAKDLLSQIAGAPQELNDQGVDEAQKGELEKAKATFLDALKIDPRNPEILNNLGAVYQNQKDPKTAIDYYLKALKESTDYGDAHYNAATAYLQLGDKKNALIQATAAQKAGRDVTLLMKQVK